VPISFSRRFTGEALAIGLRGQVGNVLQFLNLRLDLLLVPALLNLASAGVYLVAVRISEVITQVSSSSAAFLFPHVAAQEERDATETTERAARMTLLVVVLGGLPLALLAEPILSAAFGAEFASGALTVRIMLLAMIPLSIVRLLAGDLKGRGRPGLVSLAALLALVATVVLDLLLIPWLGIDGAALASLLTYTVSAAVLLRAYRGLTGGSMLALVPTPDDARRLVRIAATLTRTGPRSHPEAP
jgi:O-antigen/teichoic acid export membrane protein